MKCQHLGCERTTENSDGVALFCEQEETVVLKKFLVCSECMLRFFGLPIGNKPVQIEVDPSDCSRTVKPWLNY